MTQVLTYEQIDRTAWQQLVRMSKTGTWFQSPEAYVLYASLPEVMTPFVVAIINYKFEIINPKSSLRALCVGYMTQEKSRLRQFFTRRAIILGGPCLADDATNEEVEALMSALSSHLSPLTSHLSLSSSHLSPFTSPIYIETRNFNDFSPWCEAFEKAGFAYKPHLNFHVTTKGFETRLSDNRKRQVKKSDVLCESANSEEEIRQWYAVLAELYRTKVRTPLFPLAFFLEAYRQGVGRFLLVKHRGTIIGGSMVVADEKCVYEWFECGLNARYRDQYPSVMATYAGLQMAQRLGWVRYDMMGAGEPGVPYGVRDFKAEFGGTLVEHGRFLHICQPFLYRLGTLAVRILKRN